ncbi:hypothetical protein KKA14_08790, partial [bacterium]|nr:hypothetical protein [bacterium]
LPQKSLGSQTPEDKVYVLKLIAHQMLGSKWIYYRKIKHGDKGMNVFKKSSMMEQMKATRSALRFTTKNAKKLYRFAYQECIKDIKNCTGLKDGFPELPEVPDGEETPSLTSEFDAVIISWTPIKFLLPVLQLRAKGLATQRHTEGLAAKLFFKVAGYYADPTNWDRYQLNLYVRKIKKNSSYQEISAALQPLKDDLTKFLDVYEPFKFGKASLSKDVTQDVDAFDDAMGVESIESQINSLYWYNFIYEAIELFLFKYYLTLVTSTSSNDAILQLNSIFSPVLMKAIEVRSIFQGSFETDRTKRAFRIPYKKLVKEKEEAPLMKKIKTQQGIFETYQYNLPLLEKLTISYEIMDLPAENSGWGKFMKRYILNINRPSIFSDNGAEPLTINDSDIKEKADIFENEKAQIEEENKKFELKKAKFKEYKKKLIQKAKQLENIADKDAKIKLEEDKAKLLNEELKFDKEFQGFKEKRKKFEERLLNEQFKLQESSKKLNLTFLNDEDLKLEEGEITKLQTREFVLMNIMTTIINCSHFNRLARFKILERFKERVKGDQELEQKRMEEIQKMADKKLRELSKKKSKMERLKQQDTVSIVEKDIEKFKAGVEERIKGIKRDSQNELLAQKDRLNSLFQEISKEKSVDLGFASKKLLQLCEKISPDNEFIADFPKFVTKNMQEGYIKDFEPFYKNVFSILDLPISEKMLIIQALEKSGDKGSVKLSLGEKEQEEFQAEIERKKADLEKLVPDLFVSKVIFQTSLIPIDNLLKMSIDHKSLNNLLLLKIASPKTSQNFSLNADTIKGLLELNKLINPIPQNIIVQAGKEKEKNPEKRINSALLANLLN